MWIYPSLIAMVLLFGIHLEYDAATMMGVVVIPANRYKRRQAHEKAAK
jgi:hypothetical protein